MSAVGYSIRIVECGREVGKYEDNVNATYGEDPLLTTSKDHSAKEDHDDRRLIVAADKDKHS